VLDKINARLFKEITHDCKGKSIKEMNLFSSKSIWDKSNSDLDLNKDCSNFISKSISSIAFVDQCWLSLMSTLEESPIAQGLGDGTKFFLCKYDSLLSYHG
jgi:hypothetical protein